MAYGLGKFSEWVERDIKKINTPFNIESILSADKKLLDMWKEHPFYLDIEDDRVVVKYL